MARRPLARPFELAVGLNPQIDPAAIATFATQDEANAAVEAEADRYAARYGVTQRTDQTDKRGYRRIRLTLAPDPSGVIAHVELLARYATSEPTPR